MKILITGSSGFIGTYLTQRLKDISGLIGLDRILPPGSDAGIRRYAVNIANRDALFRVFQDIRTNFGQDLDCVFHLAAHYDFSNKKDRLYEEVNERGTSNLLEALKDFQVGAFVFTSSTAALQGLTGQGQLRESSPFGSILHYGGSKRRAEEIVLGHKDSIKVIIVRLSGVYNRQCRLIPLAHQIASIYRGHIGSRFLPAGGSGCISYVHIEDVLCAFERIMAQKEKIPSGSVYILSEEDYLPYAELYRLISKGLSGNGKAVISLPGCLLLGGVYAVNYYHSLSGKDYFFKPWMVDFSRLRYCFSAEKARKELGWKPRHSLRNYLGEILEGLKTDPDGWLAANNINW